MQHHSLWVLPDIEQLHILCACSQNHWDLLILPSVVNLKARVEIRTLIISNILLHPGLFLVSVSGPVGGSTVPGLAEALLLVVKTVLAVPVGK